MASRHGAEDEPQPDPKEEGSGMNVNRSSQRRRLPEDELKLLNDLSDYPHLAAMLEAEAVLRSAQRKEKTSGAEKNAAESGSLSQTDGKEQQERSRLLESIAKMCRWMIEKMENSDGNTKANNRKKRRKKNLRDDELKLLNDLRGFHHLAATFRAHTDLGARKATKKNKMNGPVMSFSEKGCQPQPRIAAPREDAVEGAHELLQIFTDADTLEVTDCPSSSAGHVATTFSNSGSIGELISPPPGDLVTEEQEEKFSPDECDGTTEEGLLPLAEDILPMKLFVDAGDQDACRDVSRSMSIGAKSAIAEENIVLRKLLKWRYFDSGDEKFHLEGHAVKSAARNERKRCYVCGDIQHTGNKCRKRRTCYFCNERGHLAEDCPKSSQEYNICLRCGESGHDLFSCNNDYPPDDLKNIVCYICNKGGHICCHTYTNISPDTVSCYNCGESGHAGVQCSKPHMDKKSLRPPSLCYKCGKEGHAARKCGVPVQDKRQQPEG